MALTLARFVPVHRRSYNTGYGNVPPVRSANLLNGHPVWTLGANGVLLTLGDEMPDHYTGQQARVSIFWTVPTGVAGNVNFGIQFERAQAGVTNLTSAFPPWSALFTVLQAAPTPKILQRLDSGLLSNANLQSVASKETFRIQISRQGGTTIVGDAYVLGVEFWIP